MIVILRLAAALFVAQAGFHAYTAALPLALARGGVADATIGLVMGSAALVQIPAALAGGRLVDRFGGERLFRTGAIAYLAATTLLLLPGIEPDGAVAPFFAVRVLQGIGIGTVVPAALSLVPRLLPAARHSAGLAYVGAAQNLTLVVMPPLSIALLDAATLRGVGVAVVAFVGTGLLLAVRLPVRPVAAESIAAEAGGAVPGAAAGAAPRRLGITFRRAWSVPLVVVVLYVAHWGAVTAYLPVRAADAGADIGLYFAADGVSIFLMRLPSGWLIERVEARTLIASGAVMTGVAIGLLLLPLTTPLLLVSGLLGGAGGALVLTPILVILSRRATDTDRGSAFALFSGGLAAAMTLGSVGGAPVVALAGLPAALGVGIALIGGAIALTLADASLRSTGGGTAAGPASATAAPA